jgi:hypothetical protein
MRQPHDSRGSQGPFGVRAARSRPTPTPPTSLGHTQSPHSVPRTAETRGTTPATIAGSDAERSA